MGGNQSKPSSETRRLSNDGYEAKLVSNYGNLEVHLCPRQIHWYKYGAYFVLCLSGDTYVKVTPLAVVLIGIAQAWGLKIVGPTSILEGCPYVSHVRGPTGLTAQRCVTIVDYVKEHFRNNNDGVLAHNPDALYLREMRERTILVVRVADLFRRNLRRGRQGSLDALRDCFMWPSVSRRGGNGDDGMDPDYGVEMASRTTGFA